MKTLGWGGINGQGRYYAEGVSDDKRISIVQKSYPNFILKEQFSKGEDIVVLGQAPEDRVFKLNKVDYTGWLRKTWDQLLTLTDRKILYRPHPRRENWGTAFPPVGVEILNPNEPLLSHLDRAWATVAYSSSSGVHFATSRHPSLLFL